MEARNYSLRDDRHAAAPSDESVRSVTQYQREGVIALMFASIEARDLIGEDLFLAREELMAAVKTRNAALIGRLVLAVADAYAERLAEIYLYGAPSMQCQSAQEAAAAVMLGAEDPARADASAAVRGSYAAARQCAGDAA